jgi:hypothetical protein
MIRWMRGAPRRCTTSCVIALAIAMAGCSPEDKPGVDSAEASEIEIEIESEMGGAVVLPEADEIKDPELQARIDLMTREATESVVRAANFLAAQMSFRVVADISFDALQSDGRLLEFGERREISIRRPDRARVDAEQRDGDVRTLYFDGSAISVDLPGHDAFVRVERPGTLYAALEYLSEELGAPVPLANLFSENFAAPLETQIAAGHYVGQARIDGRRCEHFAFRLPEVDVQLWIEEGDRPLVARIVLTHKHDKGNPQFRATLRDWDLMLETPDALFSFEPKEGSERLVVGSFVTPETPGETGGEATE